MDKEAFQKKRILLLNISTFLCDKTVHYIGRKSDCDLVINDPSFSREQTMFTYDPIKKFWYIKDGGTQILSRTGTW